MSVWSVEAVTEFISKYKAHQCLWKVSDPDYRSRAGRGKAVQELVAWCRSIGFKTADGNFVKKKIQNLRGCFRKELRKLMSSLEQGHTEEDVYKSNLFYFDQMLFTKDQEETANEEEVNEEERESNDEWETKNIAIINVPCAYADSGGESPTPAENSSVNSRKYTTTDEIKENWSQPARGAKRRITQEPPHCSNGFSYSELTETDAIGITVSRKLARMNETQALYAETIINTVLRKGVLNKLTEETDLCENQCAKNFL